MVASSASPFLGATQQSAKEINDFYQALNNDPRSMLLLSKSTVNPARLSAYQPQLLNLEQHLNLQSGDLGMHLLLAPAHLPVRL